MRTSRRPGRTRLLAGSAALAAAVWSAAVTLGWAPPASSAVPPPPTPGPPPGVPAPGHAYLGGSLEPAGEGPANSPAAPLRRQLQPEMRAVNSLNALLERPLSIVSAYQDWAKPLYDSETEQILAAGAIPMINWNCGDTDSNVAAGRDDTTVIKPFAEKLAALAAPVLLRWFYDPNLTAAAGTARCLGGDGAAGYVGAFTHIRRVFQSVGATNVAFVWSVDPTAGDRAWSTWFPGAANVDWIAADDSGNAGPDPASAGFAARFQSWYDTFSAVGRPLMVAGTGAPTADQAAYLADVASAVPARFPLLRAFVYSDALPGGLPLASVHGASTALTAAATGGMVALSREPFFQPPRYPASVTVSAPATTVAFGQAVKLTATVAAPHPTGSVSYSMSGRPLPGCGGVPVRTGGACAISSLPAGTDTITAVYSGDAQTAGTTSAPVSLTVSPSAAWTGPPAIPGTGSAYLGAWVQPQAAPPGTSRLAEELQVLPAFDAALGRPLSVVHVFQSWGDPAPNPVLRRVLATGAIPMVDWKCGDSDANVAAGADDALITRYADQLAALGSPVFLRWYWEPNFNISSSPSAARCLDPAGQALGPAGYVAAFRHIHDLFAAAGASNVAFVWSVGSAGTDQDMVDYYPGSQYVDWIGVDGYARTPGTTAGTPTAMFGRWYSWFSSLGLPMMISETGAVAGAQPSYLRQLSHRLLSLYPRVKAVAYLDAPSPSGARSYVLDSGGLAAFVSMSRSSYFQPGRRPTVTALSVVTGRAPTRSGIAIKVVPPAPDGGGAVTVTADGAAIPGCQNLPLRPAPVCRTPAIGPGAHAFAASFSGDWLFAPSLSAPVVVTVPAAAPAPAEAPPAAAPPAVSSTGVTPPGLVNLEPQPEPVFSGQPTVAALSPLHTVPETAHQPAGAAPLESAGGWTRPDPPGAAPTGPGPELSPSAGSNGAAARPVPIETGSGSATAARLDDVADPPVPNGPSVPMYLLISVLCAQAYLIVSWLREEQLNRRQRMPLLEKINPTGR